MADDGAGNGGNDAGGGGKGALGELVKAESMIQLAIALPAGCLIGWLGELAGSALSSGLDRDCRDTNWGGGGIRTDLSDGVAVYQAWIRAQVRVIL
ncbi:hypothetical protein [Tunturiibacter empetritectus]|uniref:hypothetical protein n=1 Tax=Tunturiibacter empetritectus TaxID=3069691 RepID=UPI003D9BDEEB